MHRKTRFVSIIVLFALVLSACNLPSSGAETESANAVLTAAAQTVEANLTQAAAANPTATTAVVPTSTTASPDVTLVVPTNTLPVVVATATQDCDKGDFVTDVTVPDGTVLNPNESFTKTWRIKNTGTCSWTPSYAFVFSSGDAMSGPATQSLVGNVNPGDTVDISVNLKAPATAGSYKGYWKLRNATGVLFATVYVDIKVGGGGSFAVTSVKKLDAYYISGHGEAFSAEITVNTSGEVQYHWIIRESGHADLETAVDSVTFNAAGAKDVSLLWTGCPHSGSFTASIYIDKPNHQEFGSVDFNCP